MLISETNTSPSNILVNPFIPVKVIDTHFFKNQKKIAETFKSMLSNFCLYMSLSKNHIGQFRSTFYALFQIKTLRLCQV